MENDRKRCRDERIPVAQRKKNDVYLPPRLRYCPLERRKCHEAVARNGEPGRKNPRLNLQDRIEEVVGSRRIPGVPAAAEALKDGVNGCVGLLCFVSKRREDQHDRGSRSGKNKRIFSV